MSEKRRIQQTTNNELFIIPDELNSDWLKAARLKELADKGNKKAKKELDRMEKTRMVRY